MSQKYVLDPVSGKKMILKDGKLAPADDIENKDKNLENDYSEVLKTGEIKGTMDSQPGKIIQNADQASDFLEKQHARLEEEYKKTEQYRKQLTAGIVACGLTAVLGISVWALINKHFSDNKNLQTLKYIAAGLVFVGIIGGVTCALIRANDEEITNVEKAKNQAAKSKVESYKDMMDNIGSGATEYTEGYKVGASFTPKHTEMQKQFHSVKLANYFNQARKELGQSELDIESHRAKQLYNNNVINNTHYRKGNTVY